jgi:hypothetical protein
MSAGETYDVEVTARPGARCASGTEVRLPEEAAPTQYLAIEVK